MLASLRWGLRHLVSDAAWSHVVVLPVDHPLVSASSVRALVAAAAAAAVPTHRGHRGHPVCLSREPATALANDRLAAATLRDVLAAIHPVEVPVDDPGVLANCNTPEALRAALNKQRF
jgi:CTP:molybdopterin cytidylyltransferase MocA